MVHFVGAGSGAPDLITLRGKKYIEDADVIIYAGSLVNPDLLKFAKPQCVIYDSSKMTLEQIADVIKNAEKRGECTVRLHTGDPSLYSAAGEQMLLLDEYDIKYDITPGVSSFCAAAASLKTEYTLPSVSQTVIISRQEGRTFVPPKEKISDLAMHNSTMVLFLSTGLIESTVNDLLKGGYSENTPAAVVYKASWDDELVLRCTIGTLEQTVGKHGISKTALLIIGDVLSKKSERSRLYDPSFSTEYREKSK